VGTVVFGLISVVSDYRIALLLAACLFLPAGLLALALPELKDRRDVAPTERRYLNGA
jgi:hypothetical protein